MVLDRRRRRGIFGAQKRRTTSVVTGLSQEREAAVQLEMPTV